MNRRTFLTRTGAALGVGGLAGCSFLDDTEPDPSTETPAERGQPAEPSPDGTRTADRTPTTALEEPLTRYGITFETVVHAVDDLGMDPNGEQPIDSALDSAYGDGTLVVFPPGEYLAEKQHDWKRDVDSFGMLGLGGNQRAVQFVFPKGNRGASDPANYWFLRVENGRNHLLENVTIQQTDDKVTGVGLVFYLEDGLQIHDVELAGFNPGYNHDPGFGIIAAITARAGVGVIDGFTCTEGGVVDLYPKRKIPIASYRNHVGELDILNAHVANAGEHSMYVSRTRGCIRVENGLFVNNDNSNLRLSGGGHPTKRSWAKDCRILIDTENAAHLRDGERYEGARGIWVEAGSKYEYGHSDLLLENVTVEAYSNARPAVLLLHEHSHGSLTVRDCSFRSEVEGATVVDSRSPFREYVEKPYDLTLQNVSVGTTALQTVSAYAIRIHSRPRSLLENLDVSLVTGDVNGVLVESSDGTRILDAAIRTQLSDEHQQIPGTKKQRIGGNTGIVVKNTENYTLRNIETSVPDQKVQIQEPANDVEPDDETSG